MRFPSAHHCLRSEWEDIDHDAVDSLAGGMMSAGSTSADSASDPLGLGAVIEFAYIHLPNARLTMGQRSQPGHSAEYAQSILDGAQC